MEDASPGGDQCSSHTVIIFFSKIVSFFYPDKPMSPKAMKGFDVPQLTKNYYSVVSCYTYFTRHLKESFFRKTFSYFCAASLFLRSFKTFWSMRESLSKNFKRYLAVTCAP